MTTCTQHPAIAHRHETDGPVFNGCPPPRPYVFLCRVCGDDVTVTTPERDENGELAPVVCSWCRGDAAAER